MDIHLESHETSQEGASSNLGYDEEETSVYPVDTNDLSSHWVQG